MGEPQSPHFYDFGAFERVPKPQNQLFLFLETPGYLNKIKKKRDIAQILCCESQHVGFHVCRFWKRQVPKSDEDPFK